jgi:hypothetical protein
MTYEGVQKMPERLDASKVRAGDEILTSIMQPEETLVRDVRADMTPAQMVEGKLIALLRSSDAGIFIGSSDLGDMERKQRTSFQIFRAVQKGRHRAAADRRSGDQAAATNWVHFLQVIKEPMSELAPVATSAPQAQPLIRL